MFSCLVKVFAVILLVKGQVIFTVLVFLVLLLHWRLSRDHVYDNKKIYNNYYMLLNNLCKLEKSSVVTWPFFVFELIDTSECSSWKTLLKITVQIVIYACTKGTTYQQFGSMPVLEEAKTMVYVTNHNMITMAMVIFKTYKMADKGEEKKEYWPKFSFILVLSSLLFVFSLLWIGKYLEDKE